jgi:PKD repeat protein
MDVSTNRREFIAILVCVVLGTVLVGCSVDEQGPPRLTSPSEFALSVTLTATPDQLPRDGSSQSVITATVRNDTGRPVSGQRLAVSSNVGTVSETEVVTGEDGRAAFAFVAPEAGTAGNTAVVRVVPLGENFQNQVVRTVTIALASTSGVTSTTAPTARFSVSLSAPVLRETVTFDATDTLDEYTDQTPLKEDDDDPRFRCLDACTYTWDFGGEATGTGRIATYRFQTARTYAVTLTVTDGAGSTGTKTKNVAVSEGDKPTASIAFSPSSPGIYETVSFTGEASKVGQAGRTITSHQWQFGDGTSASGLRVSKTYSVTGTYTVTLTVTDSAGFQGTATKDVTVVTGVTADFTISRSPAPVNTDVIFDAEKSKGSSTGFGGRNEIVKYIWNFGDSTSLTQTTSRVISHKYSGTGTYTINLTVEDSAGRRNTDSDTLKVE